MISIIDNTPNEETPKPSFDQFYLYRKMIDLSQNAE